MSVSVSTILYEMLTGSLGIVISVLKILIPLMIFIEILQAFNVMEKLANSLKGCAKLLGMSPPAILPWIVSTVMGVTYGAGTIIELNKKTPIPRKDFTLIGIFMFACHAILETTAIWGAAGANIFVISIGRFLSAFVITAVAARLPIWGQK